MNNVIEEKDYVRYEDDENVVIIGTITSIDPKKDKGFLEPRGINFLPHWVDLKKCTVIKKAKKKTVFEHEHSSIDALYESVEAVAKYVTDTMKEETKRDISFDKAKDYIDSVSQTAANMKEDANKE